ncbi:MAG: cytochrome c family protein [Candidatus Omnitrophota bacterium]|nr:cytochrome c family protein [Candidatus Omnitrophota bacterium]
MDKENSCAQVGWLSVALVACLFLCAVPASAAEHEYIGAQKCAMCHKKPEKGEQYRVWQESKHSKAYETLATPQAKEFAAKAGIDDPQKSGKCLKCHSTAYGFSETKVTEKIPVEEGISCESCHGPGKDYMKKSVMEDKEEAVAQGLIIPTEETCRKCHNEESPNFKEFDYPTMWEKIKHPIPKQ